MSKHYQFHHLCGHIGIGPVIQTATPQTPDQPIQESILSLPFLCPFCADTQPYLRVAAGDGLLAILEPRATSHYPLSTALISPYICPYSNSIVTSPEWRVLRVCAASEISPSDWQLAHAPGQHYRQMAWIPSPCGTLGIWRSSDTEDTIGSDGLVREVDCIWRQDWRQRDKVKSRLPGMWSSLMANLKTGEDDVVGER